MLPSLETALLTYLRSLESKDRLRHCPLLEGPSRVRVTSGGRPLISFCSNDYLGLASDPALSNAAVEGAHRSGFGAGGSRLVCGTLPEHLQLEAALASFLAAEAALLFPSGYQANIGLISALAGPADLIVADRSIHASLIDGCRLSRAKLAFFPHLQLAAAEHHLQRLGPLANRRLLVTESLFSMDGDFAPLSDLDRLAKQYDALLVVDEAHALGTLGQGGAGLSRSLGISPDVLIGTLGKAFGLSGAFVAGSDVLRSYLLNHTRTFMFTTAPPPPLASAAAAALRIISSPAGELLRTSLRSNICHLRSLLDLPPDPLASPIVPLILGKDQDAVEASLGLRVQGFLVQPIRPPTVREGTARLRITLSALHTHDDIAALCRALSALPTRPSRAAPSLCQRSPLPSPPQPAAPIPGIFIIGTDTAVGKSSIAAALLRLLAQAGHRPVPFKPVETGALPHPADATFLREAALRPDVPLDVVCPFPFPDPVSPLPASEAAGAPIPLSALLHHARAAAAHGSPMVVESAGGVLTPYSETLTSADLALALGYPVLLVARNSLGTVNHTCLAIREIQRRHLQFVGVLLVNTTDIATPDQATNASTIARLTGHHPLGILPFVKSPTPDNLASSLSAAADLPRLLSFLHLGSQAPLPLLSDPPAAS